MFAGGHRVEDRAQGEDVGSLIDRLALELLRRHVGRRAEDLSFRCQKLGFEVGVGVDLLRLLTGDLGETEIQDLELAPSGDHDVAGFEIAVGDAAFVGGADRVGDRDGEVEEASGVEPVLGDDSR